MIIQTGMRTDIPAFYHEWLLNRINDGFVLVRNPYNPSSVTRYSLSPNVVDLIAFCTKNPKPMLSHMDALQPYGQYWFVTITPYGKENMKKHNPKSPFLLGGSMPGDVIHDAVQKSWIDGQMRFDFE